MQAIPQAKLHELLTCIQKITLVIKEAREGAAERQDWDFGDDAQVLGIRAYKNVVKTLLELEGTLGYEWLRCQEPEGRFAVQICLGDSKQDRITLRIWRADDPDLKPEQKRMMLPIAAQYNLELFPTENGVIDRWGLVYQTNQNRLLDTAYLIGYDSIHQTVIESHEILQSESIFTGLADLTKLPEAVIFAEAPVKLKQDTIAIARRGKNDDPEQ